MINRKYERVFAYKINGTDETEKIEGCLPEICKKEFVRRHPGTDYKTTIKTVWY